MKIPISEKLTRERKQIREYCTLSEVAVGDLPFCKDQSEVSKDLIRQLNPASVLRFLYYVL